MLNTDPRLLTEKLARAVNRREFLKRASTATFAGMAALASGQLTLSSVAASTVDRRLPPVPTVPVCNPPGPYCNLDGNISEPNGCHGSSCYEHLVNGVVLQCHLLYDLYQSGCWTTAVAGGYWTCCDCECGRPRLATCGCAKWSGTVTPRPDRVGRG